MSPKVGDIYRQYDKDVQEADRIRNEEARQNERLAMDRATHNNNKRSMQRNNVGTKLLGVLILRNR